MTKRQQLVIKEVVFCPAPDWRQRVARALEILLREPLPIGEESTGGERTDVDTGDCP